MSWKHWQLSASLGVFRFLQIQEAQQPESREQKRSIPESKYQEHFVPWEMWARD